MGNKADVIKAMPVGSRWNAYNALGNRPEKFMGGRVVEKHATRDLVLRRLDKEGLSYCGWPKQTDIVKIKGDTVVMIFHDEKGEVFSTVKYTKLEG